MLSEFPFHDDINIKKAAKAFKRYAKGCSIEILKDIDGEMNDPLTPLEVAKPVIEDFFRDLLVELKSFKYQITMKVFLSKRKENGEREFTNDFCLILLQKQ